MGKRIQYSNNTIRQRVAVIAAALTLAMGVEQIKARSLGVDVYSGTGTVNWSSVHSAGISFAFTKATQGNYYEDANMAANMNNGKSAGLVMGVYDLADPKACSPSTEANYFWNYAKNYIKADGKTLMPVLDFEPQTLGESAPWNGASSASDWINQWCNDVKNLAAAQGLSIVPIIYISAGWTSTYLTSANGWTGAWIADYNGEDPQTGSPWGGGSYYQPWGSGVWDFWQYTSSGSVSGISGACDRDVMNGTSISPYLVASLASWHGWDTPGGGIPATGLTFTTAFANCSWSANRIDIFGIGSDNRLYHNYWAGAGWLSPWEQLASLPGGVTPAGGPGACANLNQANHLDDFVIGTDGNLYHQSWTGSAWSAWENVGHPSGTTVVGTPSACSWAPGRIDVYCKGADNHVYRIPWHGSWSSWTAQGGTIIGDPASCTWTTNRLDGYVVGTDNQIYHQYYDSGTWVPSITTWRQDLPETTTSYGVGICTWGINRQDMFVNTGSTIAHNWYTSSGWNGNWNETHTPPVAPASPPFASSWGVNRIDVVVLGSDGKCYHTYYGQ